MSKNDTIHTFDVTISITDNQLEQAEGQVIVFVVKNISSNAAKFCKYHTPFEGIMNDIFEIIKDGKKLSYQGILKKRSPPREEDYMNLKPGQLATCKVSLNKKYKVAHTGNYTLKFLGSRISQLNNSNKIAFKIK